MSTRALLGADFETEPYGHQWREFEASADLPSRALFWQMRTGKTKVTIDTACHLRGRGEVDAVLVFAPNGVHENWVQRELPAHHWDAVDHWSLAWRTSVAGDGGYLGHDDWWEKFGAMLSVDALVWFAFNSESMTRPDVRRAVARILRRRRVMAVFDESQDFRTPGSRRTRMARSLAARCPYRRILTGTPVTNSPLHAFSQFELLRPGALGFRRYGDFKDHHATYETRETKGGRRYPALTGYRNLDELRDRMAALSSTVLREDCHDLPDVVRTVRRITPSDEQRRVYRELHERFTVELADGDRVSVGENTARLVKLQQVMGGFLIDEYGDAHDVPGPNPKLEALSDEVYLAPGKVLVWCQFREDIDRAVHRLTADGHRVVQYHGRTSDSEKARVRELLASGAENDVKVLVGQHQAGGRGLDLSAASEVVWYSHTFDAIGREQGNERATVMGGGNVRMVDLVAPGVDEYILDNVADKVSLADALVGRGMRDALRRSEI